MTNNKRLLLTCFVSFLGHGTILTLPDINFMPPLQPRLEQAVNLEIEKIEILPDIKEASPEKKVKTRKNIPEAHALPKEETVKPEEPERKIEEKTETVSDNKSKKDMLRYQDMIKRKIQENRKYPAWAERQEIEGAALVKFMLKPDGTSHGIVILSSSGTQILDDAASETISRSNPFPAFPENFPAEDIEMSVEIVYKLN